MDLPFADVHAVAAQSYLQIVVIVPIINIGIVIIVQLDLVHLVS
jgi:hypothetical protein